MLNVTPLHVWRPPGLVLNERVRSVSFKHQWLGWFFIYGILAVVLSPKELQGFSIVVQAGFFYRRVYYNNGATDDWCYVTLV